MVKAAVILLGAVMALGAGAATQPANFPKPVVLQDVAGTLYDGVFTADGKTLVLGTSIGVYILSGDGVVRKAIGLPKEATSVAVSPDGYYAAAGVQDGTIVVITVAEGILWRTIDCKGFLTDAAPAIAGFTPDSHSVVGGGGTVGVWSADDGVLRKQIVLASPQNRMALSPDGKLLVTGWSVSGGLAAVDMESGKAAAVQPETGKETLTGPATSPRGVDFVRFTADGKHYYGGGYHTGGVFFYERGTGKQVDAVMLPGFSRGSFSKDMGLLAWTSWPGEGMEGSTAVQKSVVTVTALPGKREVARWEAGGKVGLVVMSPRGETVVVGQVGGETLLFR